MPKTLRSRTHVARGATYVFARDAISTVISVIYVVILARFLSLEEMGIYALLSFILMLVQVFGGLGLNFASTKYIAQYIAEGDMEKARSVVTRVLQISVLFSTLLFMLIFLPAEGLSAMLFGTAEYTLLFRIVAFVSILNIFRVQGGGFLRGLQRMRELAVVGLIYTAVEKIVIIYLLLYPQWGLYSVAYGWLLGLLTSSVVSLILTARFLGIFGKAHEIRTILNFSGPLYLRRTLGLGMDWVDRLFLAPYLAYLGMYNIAVRAAVVPALVSTAIVTALFPKLSELYAKGTADSLRNAFRVSTRYAVLVSFPIIAGLAASAEPVLLIAGKEYVEATLPLAILCFAAVPQALQVAIGPTLLTLERTKTAAIVNASSIISNTAMSYIALYYFNLGMVGPAWAKAFASFIGFGAGVYALKRLLHINFDKEVLWKSAVAAVVMAIAVFLLRHAVKEITVEYYLLPLYAIIGSTVYFLSLVALKAIKKHDVELIHDYLPGRFKRLAVWLDRIASIE